MPQYLGPAPVKKQAVQRIFSSLDSNGKMNPKSYQRMLDDMAQQELENEQDYQRQKGLYDSIKASNDFVPSRTGEQYTDTQYYADNRKANRERIAAAPLAMQALKDKQFAEEMARQDEANRKRQERQDAESLIFSGFDPLAQKKILDEGRQVHELTPDYLKSIDMVNEAGNGLYGAGSSNFDLNEGFLGPSIAQRRDLKYANQSLSSGTPYDPRNAPSVRSMKELMNSANGKDLQYADSTLSQAEGTSAFPGVPGLDPNVPQYSAASTESTGTNAGGNAIGGNSGSAAIDVSSSGVFKPKSKYGKNITRTAL